MKPSLSPDEKQGSFPPAKRAALAEVTKRIRLYLRLHRFEAAEKLLAEAFKQFGATANLHNAAGVLHHRQSHFVEAIESFEKAGQANPLFIESFLNLAVTLCDVSQYEKAREILTPVVQNREAPPALVLGRLANQHAQMARLYEQNGMELEAISEYRKAIKFFPRMTNERIALGRLYLRVGQLEQAQTLFEKLLEEQPDHETAQIMLGIALHKQGRPEDACHLWRRPSQDSDDKLPRLFRKIADSLLLPPA